MPRRREEKRELKGNLYFLDRIKGVVMPHLKEPKKDL